MTCKKKINGHDAACLLVPSRPPPGKPVTELRTPNQKDGFLSVLVNRNSDFYQQLYPVARGTPYAKLFGADTETIAEFAANPLYLLKEVRPGASSSADFGTSDLWVIWIFATDELAENTYSFDRDYPGEDTSVSRYVHRTHVRRNADEATPSIAYGSTLTALISVNITAPGTGYTQATGTIATGATVSFVCYGGQLILGIVTNQGTGVASGGAITITGDGTGATATARIQPAAAVLTHQEMKQLPEDDPHSHDYVSLVRIYEILPGPWLPFTRWDNNEGPIQGRRRAVVNTGQISTDTGTVKTTYEARDGSSYVSWQIEEAYGAGVPGFTDFPLLEGASLTEEVRGEIVRTSSQVFAAGEEPDAGALIISSVIEPISEFLVTKKNRYLDALPDPETWYEWRAVSLPLLIFDIIHTIFCNLSSFAKLVTNWSEDGGTTNIRKHRITVSYHTSAPELPNTVNVIEKTSIAYAGSIINFSKGDVLLDALSYDEDFAYTSGMGDCFWTEAYSYSATSPSATDYAAGDWYLAPNGFQVERFGQSMYRSTLIEYYSAAGEPPP